MKRFQELSDIIETVEKHYSFSTTEYGKIWSLCRRLLHQFKSCPTAQIILNCNRGIFFLRFFFFFWNLVRTNIFIKDRNNTNQSGLMHVQKILAHLCFVSVHPSLEDITILFIVPIIISQLIQTDLYASQRWR